MVSWDLCKDVQSDIFIIVYYHLTKFDITKIILKCISNQTIPCGSRVMSIFTN